MARAALLMTLFCMAACGQVPGLDAVVDDAVEAAPYPDILPPEQLTQAPRTRLTEDSEAQLDARGARLARRADTL